jgi:selenocysteine lyase/cysteine desulfurase
MDEAQRHAAEMFGEGVAPEEIVFGASSTQNLENLARGLEGDVRAGDEVIVTEEHEGSRSSSLATAS